MEVETRALQSVPEQMLVVGTPLREADHWYTERVARQRRGKERGDS